MQLFTPEAIVNIILFLAGYLISAIYSYWRNRKGRWAVIEKTSESFIFSKPSEMKEKYSIEILAGDKPIDYLVQTQFLIKNTGADITDLVEIEITFKKKGTNDTVDVLGVKTQPEFFVFAANKLYFRKSFLNSSNAYKDAIKILVYSEYPLTLQVKGSGVGWKAKYVDKAQQKVIYREFLLSILAGIGLVKIPTKQLKQKDIIDEDDEWLAYM
jgi:hypothetical protein